MTEHNHEDEQSNDIPVCPDCGGDLGHDHPFGELECIDCNRPFTPEDAKNYYAVET